MAGLPVPDAHQRNPVRREVTLVIDRSGSMAGNKIDQVRAAATQIIDGLEPGEAFNIIDYATDVRSLAPRSSRRIRAAAGTFISARTARTMPIRRTTHSISSPACRSGSTSA